MKIISGMLGMLMLTLLPLPLEAKTFYIALVGDGLTVGVNTWDNLDTIIRTYDPPNSIDTYLVI